MRCAIWYHLYNLKNVKNTHGGVLISVKLQGSSQIAQCITHMWSILVLNIIRATIHDGYYQKVVIYFSNYCFVWLEAVDWRCSVRKASIKKF